MSSFSGSSPMAFSSDRHAAWKSRPSAAALARSNHRRASVDWIVGSDGFVFRGRLAESRCSAVSRRIPWASALS
jgi:hypothetical protein